MKSRRKFSSVLCLEAEVFSTLALGFIMLIYRVGDQVRKDSVCLKNLLKEAEERLMETGVRSLEAKEVLEPATRFLQDSIFWQNQGEGVSLSLFFSQEIFWYYRFPVKFEELVVVSGRFHMKSIFP